MLPVLAAIESLGLDRTIAQALYYRGNPPRWAGDGQGAWWARELLHDGGRWLVRIVAAAALGVWLLSFATPQLRLQRSAAAFVLAAITLSVGVTGALKAVTNVDCPWDLAGFGGDRPYVGLLEHRPDHLPRARCFPGAHASSGFALVCFYFLLRPVSSRASFVALGMACLAGIAFSIGQEARGAHFISHDLAAAILVWIVQLSLHACVAGASGQIWTESRSR